MKVTGMAREHEGHGGRPVVSFAFAVLGLACPFGRRRRRRRRLAVPRPRRGRPALLAAQADHAGQCRARCSWRGPSTPASTAASDAAGDQRNHVRDRRQGRHRARAGDREGDLALHRASAGQPPRRGLLARRSRLRRRVCSPAPAIVCSRSMPNAANRRRDSATATADPSI